MEKSKQNQESEHDCRQQQSLDASNSDVDGSTTPNERQRQQDDLHIKARAHALGISFELAKKQFEEIRNNKTERKDENKEHYDNKNHRHDCDDGGKNDQNKNSVTNKPDEKAKYFANNSKEKEINDAVGKRQGQQKEQEKPKPKQKR